MTNKQYTINQLEQLTGFSSTFLNNNKHKLWEELKMQLGTNKLLLVVTLEDLIKKCKKVKRDNYSNAQKGNKKAKKKQDNTITKKKS